MAPLAQVAGQVVEPQLRGGVAAHRAGAADVLVVVRQPVVRRRVAPGVGAQRVVVRCEGLPLVRQRQTRTELLADPQCASPVDAPHRVLVQLGGAAPQAGVRVEAQRASRVVHVDMAVGGVALRRHALPVEHGRRRGAGQQRARHAQPPAFPQPEGHGLLDAALQRVVHHAPSYSVASSTSSTARTCRSVRWRRHACSTSSCTRNDENSPPRLAP